MEFCPGGDLHQKIRAAWSEAEQAGNPYQAPKQAMRWLGQSFLGLEFLHLETNIMQELTVLFRAVPFQ